MSQQAVEETLGRLVCDDSFRREFFEDAERTAERFGLELTAIELSSLRDIRLHSVESLANDLDDRIRRADSGDPRRPSLRPTLYSRAAPPKRLGQRSTGH